MTQSNQVPPDQNPFAATLTALETQIAELRKQVSEAQRQSARRAGKAEVLAALPKVGGMTAEQILKAVPVAKSSLWLHLNALEREGKVVFVTTSRGRKDGRKHTVIYHADAIVT